MDDYSVSCKTVVEAQAQVKQAIGINANAGWIMHSWSSNYPKVLHNNNIGCDSDQLIKTGSEIQSGEKVLGLK